ncbi:hypothetical protein [Rhodococcus opacus]|uniref:hypothetical protein n=1 Tax=Rhodococcus opacus TaxID=37919 RepID=UPI00386F94D6
MPGGGKHPHVAAGFGEDYLGDGRRETRDAGQQVPGRLKRFDRLGNPGVELTEGLPVLVDQRQVHADQERVVGRESSGQASANTGIFDRIRPLVSPAMTAGRYGRR